MRNKEYFEEFAKGVIRKAEEDIECPWEGKMKDILISIISGTAEQFYNLGIKDVKDSEEKQ